MKPRMASAVPAVTALLAAAAPAAMGAVRSAPRPPNIILIVADDLGYGDLGCYGQRTIRTPCIDDLARRGMRFTQVYAGSTVCAPSRCCLMTGMHTGHATVRGNARVPLRAGENSLAGMLRARGYRTALVGKWGLGEPGTSGVPNSQGFDLFYGYLNQAHAHDSFPARLWRNDRQEPLPANADGAHVTFSNDVFTAEAIRFVEESRERPFFLYLAYTVPHANSTERTMESAGIDPLYADEPWPEAEKHFASAITRMDRDVGALVKRVDALGLRRDTVIFFTSDNGPHREGGHSPRFFDSSGPLRGIKRDLYEGGIRVPMLVRWPGRIPAGHVSDQHWAFWDVLPTCAELAGARSPSSSDGISVVPALMGGRIGVRPPLYWEFHEGGFQQAARIGGWKAVRRGPDKPIELYAIVNDVAEAKDVSAAHPEVVRRFEEYLRSARTESEDFPVRTP